MKVVIINWSKGENDPFTIYSGHLKNALIEHGKVVEVIDCGQSGWTRQMLQLHQQGVEFVITFQGIVSGVKVIKDSNEIFFWDLLRVPLIALHGDHPCHEPMNHMLERNYCLHQYSNPDFARYSDQHFRKKFGAKFFTWPIIYREDRLDTAVQNCFVIVKNIKDPSEFELDWRTQEKQGNEFSKYCLAASELLRSKIRKMSYLDIHKEIDALIEQEGWSLLSLEENVRAYHQFHSKLDYYFEGYKSIVALEEVRDFPVKIYGRGWDIARKAASPSHEFCQPKKMADSQSIFYTSYGLIDIAPSRCITDRARRAMANKQPFISNASIQGQLGDFDDFENLFFDIRPGQLHGLCDRIVSNVEGHKETSLHFARFYDRKYPDMYFIDQLTLQARMLRSS